MYYIKKGILYEGKNNEPSGNSCDVGCIPGPGISACHGRPQPLLKKKKKKKDMNMTFTQEPSGNSWDVGYIPSQEISECNGFPFPFLKKKKKKKSHEPWCKFSATSWNILE